MSKGNPFIALRLPREEEQSLRTRAKESGASLSQVVRDALAHYTTGNEKPAQITSPPKAKRARAASRPVRLQRVIGHRRDRGTLGRLRDLAI